MSERYIIGWWCTKGHLDLYTDDDADMACWGHSRPVFIEAERSESAYLPSGHFERAIP
jgi:hypothetical protein